MEYCEEYESLFDSLLTGDHKVVILDFSKIRFVDSTGVGLLLRWADIIRKQNSVMLLSGLNRSLQSVFRLSGLLKIFKLLDESICKNYPELTE